MKKISFILLLLASLACKKKPIDEPVNQGDYQNGILALNEGLFEQNNASVSFYSFEHQLNFPNAFKAVNKRGLGDTANDFVSYERDGVAYIAIAIDVSSKVEFIERYTLKSVGEVSLLDGANAREPRRVLVNGNFAYVCNFDGTLAIINLLDFTLASLIEVGANPDGMVIVDDELFISNSGGLNYPVYDSTVSVLNLNSHLLVETFTTRINGGEMLVDSQGEIYQISRGNYDGISAGLVRIDAENHTVLSISERPISSIDKMGDWLYYYDEEEEGIYRMNMISESFEEKKIIDISSFETFSGFQINSLTNVLFCFDANGYVNTSTVHAYSINGDLLYTFQSGLNTNNLIFN
jgi:hypothetical protein